MLLIDAIYINDGGGKILLDYLIKSIEKTDISVFYLLDERIVSNHSNINTNKVQYIKASFKNRYFFYIKNRNQFDSVFCFGNIPPPIYLRAIVFTYFHQRLFLDIPKETPMFFRLKLYLKTRVLKFLLQKSNYWIVQTSLMKQDFLIKFHEVSKTNVFTIPFYPPLLPKVVEFENRKKDVFLYVSAKSPHKNHENLLKAFIKFHDENLLGELHLTISYNEIEFCRKISEYQHQGYPIFNHGFVSRIGLIQLYRTSEFIVYPSYSESFGLGIVEGIENGCKVIGSDLAYLRAVCIPELVFNPDSILSISIALKNATKIKAPRTSQLVFNEIDKLISVLRKSSIKIEV